MSTPIQRQMEKIISYQPFAKKIKELLLPATVAQLSSKREGCECVISVIYMVTDSEPAILIIIDTLPAMLSPEQTQSQFILGGLDPNESLQCTSKGYLTFQT